MFQVCINNWAYRFFEAPQCVEDCSRAFRLGGGGGGGWRSITSDTINSILVGLGSKNKTKKRRKPIFKWMWQNERCYLAKGPNNNLLKTNFVQLFFHPFWPHKFKYPKQPSLFWEAFPAFPCSTKGILGVDFLSRGSLEGRWHKALSLSCLMFFKTYNPCVYIHIYIYK